MIDPHATARRQNVIEKGADAADGKTNDKDGNAVQAGARRYPEPPFPAQHQEKPGAESLLDPAPLYDAPHYRGSGKLEGKVALITGGDSGIGRAVAVLFAREGADVAVAYLVEDEDAEETRQMVEGEGRQCLLLKGDVKDAKFCRGAVEKVVSAFGRLNVLVNNAAFQEHRTAIEDLTEAQFDETLRTNLYGYFFMAQAAIQHLGTGDAIINTGSVTGIRGSKNLVDYSMTKGGIHAGPCRVISCRVAFASTQLHPDLSGRRSTRPTRRRKTFRSSAPTRR